MKEISLRKDADKLSAIIEYRKAALIRLQQQAGCFEQGCFRLDRCERPSHHLRREHG